MTIDLRFPYDTTGRHPDNLVVRERHTIRDNEKAVCLNHGGFYTNSIEIWILGEKSNIKYRAYQMLDEVVKETGLDAAAILYLEGLGVSGEMEVEITYQAVGGKYQRIPYDFDELMNSLKYDKRTIHYNHVVGLPDQILPQRHLHHVHDIYGLGPAIGQANLLLSSIINRLSHKENRFTKRLKNIELASKVFERIDPVVIANAASELERIRPLVDGESNYVYKTTFDAHLTNYNSKVNVFEQQMEELKLRANGLGERIDKEGIKVTNLTTRVEAVESELNHPWQIELAVKSGTATGTDFISLDIDRNNKTYRLNLKPLAVETRVEQLAQEIVDKNLELSGKIETNRVNINVLRGRIEPLETAKREAETDRNDLRNRIRLIEEDNLARQRDIDGLNSRLTEQSNNHTTFTGETNRQFIALETTIEENKAIAERAVARASETAQTALTTAQEELDGKIDELRRAMQSGGVDQAGAINEAKEEAKRFATDSVTIAEGKLATRISANETAIRNINTLQSEQGDNIVTLTEHVNTLKDDVVPTLSTTVERNKNALDNLTTKVEGYNIPAMQRKLNETAAGLSTHKSETTQAISIQSSKNTEQDNRLTALENEDIATKERVVRLENAQRNLESSVETTVVNKVNEVSNGVINRVTANEGTIGRINTQLTQISQLVASSNSSQDSKINTLTTTVTALESNIEDADTKITGITQRLDRDLPYLIKFYRKEGSDNAFLTQPSGSPLSLDNGKITVRKVIRQNNSLVLQVAADSVNTLINGNNDESQFTYMVDAINPENQEDYLGLITYVDFPALNNLPVLLSREDEVTYIESLRIYKLLKDYCSNPIELLNLLRGFIRGLNPTTQGKLGIVLDFHVVRKEGNENNRTKGKLTSFVQYNNYPFEKFIDINPENGIRVVDDVTTTMQYHGVLLHQLHDNRFLDNDNNYMINDNFIIPAGENTTPHLSIRAQRTNTLLTEPTLRAFLEDRKDGLFPLKGLSNTETTIRTEFTYTPQETDRYRFELTFDTTDPYIDIRFVIGKYTAMGDIIDGGLMVRERPYREGSSVVIQPSVNGIYRVKYISPVMVGRPGNVDLPLVVAMTVNEIAQDNPTRIGKFTLTKLRGTNRYNPNKNFNPNANRLDENTINLLKSEVRKYVKEKTSETNPTQKWDITKFREDPQAEDWSEVSIGANGQLQARGVVLHRYEDGSESAVFSPTYSIKITNAQRWRVPANLVGRKAQVRVCAGTKTLSNNKMVISAISETYCILPSGEIPIRVGENTSFGQYVSVNVNSQPQNWVTPRMVIPYESENTFSAYITVTV